MEGILPREFYDRDVVEVAPELLGCFLLRRLEKETIVGRIVEVEAYQGKDDPASHSYKGKTKRCASMFGPPGRAYVYHIHTHNCINLVTDKEGVGSAVLIRAIHPLAGISGMLRRRNTEDLYNLCNGPGKLCKAFHIDKTFDGWDVTIGKDLWLLRGDLQPKEQIVTTTRIGISSAKDALLRWYIKDNPHVSKP